MGYTEKQVLDLLRRRYTRKGNGGNGEYAFLTHVRNGAGFDANRTFDAVTVNLWPSRGLLIHVHEVKVSRSDWQRELSKPDKAEDAFAVADQFSIVAPADIVRPGELPPTWGLIEVVGQLGKEKLRTTQAAPLQSKSPPQNVDRGLLVGMLRAAPGAVPGGRVDTLTADQVCEIEQKAHAEGMRSADSKALRNADALADLRERVAQFEQASGVNITHAWRLGDVGAAVRQLGSEGAVGKLRTLVDMAQRIVDDATPVIEQMER